MYSEVELCTNRLSVFSSQAEPKKIGSYKNAKVAFFKPLTNVKCILYCWRLHYQTSVSLFIAVTATESLGRNDTSDQCITGQCLAILC